MPLDGIPEIERDVALGQPTVQPMPEASCITHCRYILAIHFQPRRADRL